MTVKKKVVFVGSFALTAKDGTIGGLMIDSHRLLESPLSDYVEWYLIDSTMQSQPPPHLLIRAGFALLRILKLLYSFLFNQIDTLFIFSAYELSSLLEKGLMCILGHLAGKHVVIFFKTEIRSYSYDPWLMWFKRWVIKSTDVVICQSEAAAQALVQISGCPRSQIVVITNWIDSSHYKRPQESTLLAVRPVRFLFAGWLEKTKGVNELLEAAHMLAQQALDFTLVFCGGGTQAEVLREQCIRLNLEEQVFFRGWLNGQALIEEFWAADVFVLPSYTEGLPNVLIEAMASGLAVITTPVGGIPSVIDADMNGIFVEVGDSAGLAEAMKKLAEDRPRVAAMGKHNINRILQHHDIHQVWPQIARVLQITDLQDNPEMV